MNEDRDTEKYFNKRITARERACFEAGIALSTIYHQFVGTPVSSKTISDLESTIEKTIMLQPYRSKVEISIDRNKIREKESVFGYASLEEKDIDAKVEIRYKNAKVVARMKYFEEIKYSLMFIDQID